MARQTEYQEDRDQKVRNADAQIELTLEHVSKVRAERALFRAKQSAYWALTALLGSAAFKIWGL